MALKLQDLHYIDESSIKPKRIKIEVLIIKDNKLCLCTFKGKDYFFYGFPGGGVEGNDSFEETAKKECLEEVGVKIKNVLPLGLTKEYPPLFIKQDRNDKFSGVIKHFYYALYDGIDRTLFNSEGDGVKFFWVTAEEAIRKVKINGSTEHGAFRADAVAKLQRLKVIS